MWHSCRLNSWLIGSLMVTTTLHTSSIPPWGMLWFSARRTGTNPASPVITKLLSFIPIPACLNNLIHPAPEPVQKSNWNYPRISVLRCRASAAMTTTDPTVIEPVGINTTIKNNKKSCVQYNYDNIGTRPVYCNNFLVTQLNRLSITPE